MSMLQLTTEENKLATRYMVMLLAIELKINHKQSTTCISAVLRALKDTTIRYGYVGLSEFGMDAYSVWNPGESEVDSHESGGDECENSSDHRSDCRE